MIKKKLTGKALKKALKKRKKREKLLKKKLKRCKKQARQEEKKSIKKKVKKLQKKLKKIKKERKKDTKRIKKTQHTRETKKSQEKNHKHEASQDRGSKSSSRKKHDVVENGSASIGPSIDLMTSNQSTMTPMTREEWEKQESVVRRVYDQESGRHRLIKGSGEVLEECVSRDRHRAINKAATQNDGEFFQSNVKSRASKP